MKRHYGIAFLGGLIMAAAAALPSLSHAAPLGIELDTNVSAELKTNNGNNKHNATVTASSTTEVDARDNRKSQQDEQADEVKNEDKGKRFGIFGKLWASLTGDDDTNATTTASSTATVTDETDEDPSLFLFRILSVKSDAAMILWFSSDRSTGRVWLETDEGINTTVIPTASDDSFKFLHKFKIEDLEADTTYHVKVASTDKDGNTAISTAHTFTTRVE